MKTRLRILAPTRYPWRFNGPRKSRHDIVNRDFLPLNKISPAIEGFTVFNPFPLKRFDLIHAFNRIPLGRTPFIIGFESHLPRAFNYEHTAYFSWLSHILASPRCRGIIAISEYAKRTFLLQHKDKPWLNAIASKLHVRHPNLPPASAQDPFLHTQGGPLRLVFVGSHFGRKGGPVAVRMAELAHEYGLNLHIDIVSDLTTGKASWVDPLTPDFFQPYNSKLNTLRNVKFHGGQPNDRVIALLKQSHFSLLPTFSDTFGFSAIESMANHVPVIATTQGALPEFINSQNGILLHLPTNEIGEWRESDRQDRESAAYANLFSSEIERLAREALLALQPYADCSPAYMALRKAAYTCAASMFNSENAATFWDEFYMNAL